MRARAIFGDGALAKFDIVQLGDWVQRRWLWLVLLFWAGTGAWLIYKGWGVENYYGIQGFGLGDTDDNLRFMQVRAWLEGQDWYDLRQHRLNPPDGLNVHWSRLPDLPIALLHGIIEPLFGTAQANRWSVALAPLFPLLVVMGALGLVARRLLSVHAFWLALILILFCGSTVAQFAPTRIDHHGWQLAMLAVALAGLADPRQKRGGITLGVASGLSMVIGLEMLLYLALAGGAMGLMWVADRGEARRLAAYGASFGATSAIGFLIFASNDNWAPMCDVLSPVWLSVVLAAAAIALALAWTSPEKLWQRLGLALVGGALLAGFYAGFWPDCLGRLERVPEELDRLWLSNVREAMPVWRHGLGATIGICTLPVIGLIGYLVILWRTRRAPEFRSWAAIAYMAALATGLLLWQTRAAGPAQMLAVPGAAALAWTLVLWFHAQKSMLVRVIGITGSFLLVTGVAVTEAWGWWDEPAPRTDFQVRIDNANWRCPQPWAMAELNKHERGLMLTSVDLGPRLVVLTHHDAITGPYHRNSAEILDIMRAFRGDAAQAKEIIDRRNVDYVLLCPDLSETTLYAHDAPEGWYVQLIRGQIPEWLEPVTLPKDWPFRLWRVRR